MFAAAWWLHDWFWLILLAKSACFAPFCDSSSFMGTECSRFACPSQTWTVSSACFRLHRKFGYTKRWITWIVLNRRQCSTMIPRRFTAYGRICGELCAVCMNTRIILFKALNDILYRVKGFTNEWIMIWWPLSDHARDTVILQTAFIIFICLWVFCMARSEAWRCYVYWKLFRWIIQVVTGLCALK